MLEQLIYRARRRYIFNEAIRQLALAGAVVIGGLALVLIAGTRYLEWWTLALFALAGTAIGAQRVWRGLPDDYETALRLDGNAGLSDTISTAVYFSKHAPAYPEFHAKQRQQAEAAALGIHLDSSIPFTFPRALYAMAGLALLASSLAIVRFAITHKLDLRAPLTEILFEDEAAKQATKPKRPDDPLRRKRLEAAESLLAKMGVPVDADDQKQNALDKAIDQALESAGVPADKGQKAQMGKSDDGKSGNALEQSPEGDPLGGKDAQGADQGGEDKEQGKPGGQNGQSDKANSKSNKGDGSSLMSKLKDAVSNMLSKASPDKSGQKGQPQQGQTGKAEKGAGEKGNNDKGQQGQNDGDSDDGEPNGGAQEGQQAQGKAGSKASDPSADAGSGIGNQDGAKDLRAAEQLKAMGKISEIIGKRAATVTGETTIEVQSGNQQLRTAYSKKSASHNEADSDVSRDEIPVSMQSYVQEYFKQVRGAQKTKPAPKTVAAPQR